MTENEMTCIFCKSKMRIITDEEVSFVGDVFSCWTCDKCGAECELTFDSGDVPYVPEDEEIE